MGFAQGIQFNNAIFCAVAAKNTHGVIVQNKTVRIIMNDKDVVLAGE
jgi:hypothetical protein